ncbi:disulfide bond formation protein B [Bacillus sp. Bva_UNVM-123]|uniref:disulfide oxidoreductase n=1 Tax=Bacillus sp. Bva_UNVM-123 TaxID=2829798 RepID=UPI00391FC4E9
MKTSTSNYNVYYYAAALVVAIAATLGSLYYSEVKNFVPCSLCWYQRIFMYPLPVILGIAVYYNEAVIKKYILSIAFIGWFIALYHVLLQKIPAMKAIEPCKQGIPCSVDYVNYLGFITIPMLSLTAFTLIIIFVWRVKK